MTATYFTHEAPIVAALETITGLEIRTAADADEALQLATSRPTAVVVLDADEVLKANEDAFLVRRGVSVHVFFVGATTEREAEDGEVVHAVVWKLHGALLQGYDAPLMYEGADSALADGVREYRLSFATKATFNRPR